MCRHRPQCPGPSSRAPAFPLDTQAGRPAPSPARATLTRSGSLQIWQPLVIPQLMTFPSQTETLESARNVSISLAQGGRRVEIIPPGLPAGRGECHTNVGPRAHTQHVGAHMCIHTMLNVGIGHIHT